MSAERSIVPRYIAFLPTGTNATTVTGAPNGTTIFAGLEVEGLTRQLEPIESLIEDNQTSLDSIDLNIEGFVRGSALLNAANVNRADVTANLKRCKVFILGAPGTLSFGVDNAIASVHFRMDGGKERVRFKITKKLVRDVGVAGSDLEVFTTA